MPSRSRTQGGRSLTVTVSEGKYSTGRGTMNHELRKLDIGKQRDCTLNVCEQSLLAVAI
jgi:hypothetical protein